MSNHLSNPDVFAQNQVPFAENELLFRNIMEYAPIGMCIVDATFHYTFVNNAFCNITGYSKDELLCKTPMDITYYEDLILSQDKLESLVAGEIDSYQVEKRYICRDGKLVWVYLTTSLIRDLNQENWIFVGQVQDITARKLADEKLRLASTVYYYSNEAMMISDENNLIIATNPAFTELTGYSAQEVIGKNPRLFASGRQTKEFYEEMWQKISSENHWEGDVWNKRKNGEVYAEHLSISAVRDEKGKIQNYVALFSDITEKKKANDKIWELANYDPLTRLPNRRLFNDRLAQSMRKADREKESLALLFIDLDHFKEVNDTLGHMVGDELLIRASNRISAKVRASDTVARLGGDEFTAILSDFTNTTDVGKIAQSLINELNQPFVIDQNTIQISASIGVAIYPEDANSIESLINCADQAMYLSKQQGRNQFTHYSARQAK